MKPEIVTLVRLCEQMAKNEIDYIQVQNQVLRITEELLDRAVKEENTKFEIFFAANTSMTQTNYDVLVRIGAEFDHDEDQWFIVVTSELCDFLATLRTIVYNSGFACWVTPPIGRETNGIIFLEEPPSNE